MIISLLSEDPNPRTIDIAATHLAKKYGENVINYCEENAPLIAKTEDDRLTLLGHGSREVFGIKRLTAKMLAADLLCYNLPKTIKIIDLVGCNIGEVSDEASYVEQFTAELHKHKEYQHIQVNAFTNRISEAPLAKVLLTSNQDGNNLYIEGLTSDAKKQYDEQLSQALNEKFMLNLKREEEFYLEQKIALHKQIRELKLKSKDSKEIDDHITKLKTQLPLIEKQRKKYSLQYQNEQKNIVRHLNHILSHRVYSGKDIRRTLDNNPNFHHGIPVPHVSQERKTALIPLYTHIAAFKEALFEAKNTDPEKKDSKDMFSLFPSHATSIKDIAEKINLFENLANAIKNPDKSAGDISQAMREIYNGPKSNKEDKKLIEKISTILSIDPNQLSKKPQNK